MFESAASGSGTFGICCCVPSVLVVEGRSFRSRFAIPSAKVAVFSSPILAMMSIDFEFL